MTYQEPVRKERGGGDSEREEGGRVDIVFDIPMGYDYWLLAMFVQAVIGPESDTWQSRFFMAASFR